MYLKWQTLYTDYDSPDQYVHCRLQPDQELRCKIVDSLGECIDEMRRLWCDSVECAVWPQGYKTFFMLNSAQHEIFSANNYENANNSWHFHIY